jgi:hypothetical protein
MVVRSLFYGPVKPSPFPHIYMMNTTRNAILNSRLDYQSIKKFMNKNLGIIASSVDPSKIAATVQGLIISVSSIIILVAGHFNIIIGDGEIQLIASQLGLIAGAGYMLYGLVRKLTVWLSQWWANRGTDAQG